MRISWLEPDVIQATRDALAGAAGDWDALLEAGADWPPAPRGVPTEDWPHIAEHVMRAERVSAVVREQGFHGAVAEFGSSPHAVELATLASAAVAADSLELGLIERLLSCEIDELIVYGTFLGLLVEVGSRADTERMVELYERFCDAAARLHGSSSLWRERVAAMRDGLGSAYVLGGRNETAHELFSQRHREATDDLVVALGASRAFLAAGDLSRAICWLELGAVRANELGRTPMADKLRTKAEALRSRLS
jgi:hypothetical protein